MTTIDSNVKSELAPTGALRVAVNYGNPVHTQRNPRGRAARGRAGSRAELAKRVGVP
jgi:hypothetical protein